MTGATEWTRFRGPNGSGIGEGNFPAEWKESDFAWKVELPGTGHGSPVVWGEKIFCVDKEGMVSVIAASKDFKLLGQNDLGDVCRSAPAISGGMMYVRTFGKLFAVKGGSVEDRPSSEPF